MDRVRRQIHYEYIERLGLTGRNRTVCVLDTGISPHYDFDSRIIKYIDFTEHPLQYIHDDSGHGTHVCGILAGSGRASQGLYKGIAPQANLVVLKILDKKGNGYIDTLIEALQWLTVHAIKYGICVVNISISISPVSSLSTDEEKKHRLKNVLKKLHDQNVLIVTAAGNEGPDNDSLSVLGEQPYTLCVGCHDGNYKSHKGELCEYYSGRGTYNGKIIKPDMVAPGTEIISCQGKSRYGYTKKSGTSMSCPIISGIAVNLFELMDKKAGVDEISDIMRHGTIYVHAPRNQQGFGMVDCKKIFEPFC